MSTSHSVLLAPSPWAGLIRDLFGRRVPYWIGVYAGASWLLFEFTNQVVMQRWLFFEHYEGLVLWPILLLLPSVIMVAWFHGKPGRDRNTLARTEQIGVPANLALCGIVPWANFADTPLGRMTTARPSGCHSHRATTPHIRHGGAGPLRPVQSIVVEAESGPVRTMSLTIPSRSIAPPGSGRWSALRNSHWEAFEQHLPARPGLRPGNQRRLALIPPSERDPKMKHLLALAIAAVLSTGCASTPPPPMDHDFQSVFPVEASVDVTWDIVVGYVAERGWALQNIDGASRFLNTVEMRFPIADLDCGFIPEKAEPDARFHIRVAEDGTGSTIRLTVAYPKLKGIDCTSRGTFEGRVAEDILARIKP